MFGGGIQRKCARWRSQGRGRRRKPNMARAFSVLHQRRKGLRGPDHAVDIDAERPLDGVGLAGQNGRANANACIDPQQIKRAMGP